MHGVLAVSPNVVILNLGFVIGINGVVIIAILALSRACQH